jgi:hypothetical protein
MVLIMIIIIIIIIIISGAFNKLYYSIAYGDASLMRFYVLFKIFPHVCD